MEKTLILIKPDAIQRELVGEIIKRIEKKGFKIIGLKMIKLSDQILKIHYLHLSDKPFFGEIKEFMKATPVICMCIEGMDAIETIRKLCGVTRAREASPGTIRGDLAMSIQCNLIHASDSKETADTEIQRFFNDDELFEYGKILDEFVYAPNELSH